jgi:hypothetical protein
MQHFWNGDNLATCLAGVRRSAFAQQRGNNAHFGDQREELSNARTRSNVRTCGWGRFPRLATIGRCAGKSLEQSDGIGQRYESDSAEQFVFGLDQRIFQNPQWTRFKTSVHGRSRTTLGCDGQK